MCNRFNQHIFQSEIYFKFTDHRCACLPPLLNITIWSVLFECSFQYLIANWLVFEFAYFYSLYFPVAGLRCKRLCEPCTKKQNYVTYLKKKEFNYNDTEKNGSVFSCCVSFFTKFYNRGSQQINFVRSVAKRRPELENIL